MEVSIKTILWSIFLVCCAVFLLSHTDMNKTLESPKKVIYDSIDRVKLIDTVLYHGNKLVGKPYLYRGQSAWAMDCSGYIAYIFYQENITLPRSSRGQAAVVEEVGFENLERGDLLFFKGSNLSSSKIGHVAIVSKLRNDSVWMMHSRSIGIVEEPLTGFNYFEQRKIKAGRIPNRLLFKQ